MGHIGLPEIIIVFAVILLLFGAKKLPEVGKALGKAIKEFRKAGSGTDDSTHQISDNKDNEQSS